MLKAHAMTHFGVHSNERIIKNFLNEKDNDFHPPHIMSPNSVSVKNKKTTYHCIPLTQLMVQIAQGSL